MLRQPEDRFVEQAEERTAQHAEQGDFVGRAFQRAEQIQQIVHFLLRVKGMAADEIIIDAVAAQGFFVIGDVGQRAEEQGDIALLDGAGGRIARFFGVLVADEFFAAHRASARMRRAIQSASRRRRRSVGV